MMRVIAAVCLLSSTVHAQTPDVGAIRQKQVKTLASFFTGIFSNEEQVYFQGETGQKPDPRVTITIADTDTGGAVDFRDAVDKPMFPPIPVTYAVRGDGVDIISRTCTNHYQWQADRFVLDDKQSKCSWKGARFVSISESGVMMREPDGRMIDYRRARSFTCWMSIPKAGKKADGSTDWFFASGLKLHDQGGRTWVTTDEPVPQKIGYKLRNVVWPYGSNKPALTLYVYKSAEPDKAASYSWADTDAKLVGLNLRWMQGSCTRDQ